MEKKGDLMAPLLGSFKNYSKLLWKYRSKCAL